MTTDTDKYQDKDALGLSRTIIESVTISFNPTRFISFKIIKPLDHTAKVLRWSAGLLVFKGIYYSNLELINQVAEYPEFYKTAILDDSRLLRDTWSKLENVDEENLLTLKHYYLYIDQGNKKTEVHIICETHELTIDAESKLLTEFDGLDE